MKWKHKVTGWTAKTAYYESPKSSITCKMVKDDKEVEFHIPHALIEADDNWIPEPDDRWLNKHLDARTFMEAFSMTIDASGGSHDSFVVKSIIDKYHMHD